MNLYGWSKHLFDMAVIERAARGEKLPPQWAGLKFFNVFGPNEYHKGAMMSVLARRFDDIKAGRTIELFKSHRDGIADGDQRRDFIYVDDVVRVVMWLLATPSVSGLFNVGTGKARSFKDLMLSAYAALGPKPDIRYIDMPVSIRDSYQYFTQSEVDRLQRAGYNGGFTAARRSGRPLRQGLSRFAPIAIARQRQTDVRFRILSPRDGPPDRALCRRSHARRIRLRRGVADFAGSAGARHRRAAQRDQYRRRRQCRAQHRLARRQMHLCRPDRRGCGGERNSKPPWPRKPLIESVLVSDASRPTTRKVRFVSEHFLTHMLRADWEMTHPAAARPSKS